MTTGNVAAGGASLNIFSFGDLIVLVGSVFSLMCVERGGGG